MELEINMAGDYQYWPFPVSEEERQIPEQDEKLKFLESAYSDGFESYRTFQGLDNYGANSKSRSVYILQRGRKNRWEFLLSEDSNLCLSALVNDFGIAGEAVRAWLNEGSTIDIIDDINKYLINPPQLEDFGKGKKER
jgi:hypothetical protein